MSAYADLSSFTSTLAGFLSPSKASLFLPSTHLQLLQSASDEFQSLYCDTNFATMFFDRNSRRWCEREKALVEGIRVSMGRVEDMLDDLLTTYFLNGRLLEFTVDLETEINSFIHLVANAKKEYAGICQEESESESVSVSELESELESEFDVENSEEEIEGGGGEGVEYEEDELQTTSNYGSVGLVDQFIQLRRSLLLPRCHLHVIKVVGMVGIGKTAMAKQLYNDPLISKHFPCRVFISVGQSSCLKQAIIDILSKIQNQLDVVNMQLMSTRELGKYLRKCMARDRYLIVLDDVWSRKVTELPEYLNRRVNSYILLTTRFEMVTHMNGYGTSEMVKLHLLNDDESWCLFCEKVFGKYSSCPYKLVKVGKKIVEICEGLPLAIIVIANKLAQGETSLDYWTKVSEDPNPLSIGTNDQDPALNVIYSSYEELPQSYQAFFLYMGIFPRKQEIPFSKLIRLWEAEQFIRPRRSLYWYDIDETLHSLSYQGVLFVTLSTYPDSLKTCRLHSVYWYLCVSEAKKEYMFQLVNKFSRNSFQEELKGHRRICVHNNTLFGIKDANSTMLSISNVRSLLCMGPQHRYPVPMEFKTRLLRVLDVVTIRFFVFPSEVIQLVLLRYLAFTYNGMLHPSISQLWNLESLIVEQHLSIVSHDAPRYMPMEIWKMKALRHLQVTGALLPHPPNDTLLPNLMSISMINDQCLTSAVFSHIPKLEKLSILIDLSTPDPFCFSNHLSLVNTLRSLKCVVMNPKPRSQAINPPAPSRIFPSNLVKLTLSGFGYPWKYFQELAEFKRLEVVKLQNYAFQGPEWETSLQHNGLKVLHLEDLDVVHWRVARLQLRNLSKLIVRHCYGLREIPSEFGLLDGSMLDLIEVVDVQPSVVASAKSIVQQRKGLFWLKKGNIIEEVESIIKCSYEVN